MRLPYDEVAPRLAAILRRHGLSDRRADAAARLFCDASRDGVESHGLNRFPGFVSMIEDGRVDPSAEPTLVSATGAVERWDGHLGPGPLNATFAMGRAIALAAEHSIGVVGLRNTNHWMRGANYGRQAAAAGCIGICWTNTLPLMAPWGGTENAVGNNPLVIAVPRASGHVVLDMAMSQYSFGRLGRHARSGEPLPVPGGLDANGVPTDDARAIFGGGRVLPAGYWKGSGLALLLDLIAVMVSGGDSTRDIGRREGEYGVSQVFFALDTSRLDNNDPSARQIADRVESAVAFVQNSAGSPGAARYPGEGSIARREESDRLGVSINEETWQRITALEDAGNER